MVNHSSSSFHLSFIGAFLLLVLLSCIWNPSVSPSMPDMHVNLDDPNEDITVYLQSPYTFGWSRRIDRYELELCWDESETPSILRTIVIRSSSKRRAYEDLFKHENFLCSSLSIGLGKPHSLPAGRYELRLRANNGTVWGKWKRRKVAIDRPMSSFTNEDHVSICIHADGIENHWF